MKNKFSSHPVERLFERYSILIGQRELEKLNIIAKKSPQLRYSNVRRLEIQGKDVYCLFAEGKIKTFLTPEQAGRTQSLSKSKKPLEIREESSTINAPFANLSL